MAEIPTSRGYQLTLVADFNSDGIFIPLDLKILNPKGQVIHFCGTVDGVDPSSLDDVEGMYAIYESQSGEIVALFEKLRPDEIIALIDLGESMFFPSIGEGRRKAFLKARDIVLPKLEEDLGIYGLRLESPGY